MGASSGLRGPSDMGPRQEVSRCKGPKRGRHLAEVRGEQGASVAEAAGRLLTENAQDSPAVCQILCRRPYSHLSKR